MNPFKKLKLPEPKWDAQTYFVVGLFSLGEALFFTLMLPHRHSTAIGLGTLGLANLFNSWRAWRKAQSPKNPRQPWL
jgi:hypothetical protein